MSPRRSWSLSGDIYVDNTGRFAVEAFVRTTALGQLSLRQPKGG
jgi:hypothetical protein